MEEEIQYLGTKLAHPEPLSDSLEAPSVVAGVTLYVEKCGDKPAHEITFHRSRSSYVNIGRKSASGEKAMRKETDDHNAVFACQVVSARHAKLVFSDNEVYIVDLHSRHGTHLLRREEAPKTLKAEVETPLADGDIVTFGKVVGSGSCMVPPVTARVELVREKPSLNASLVGPSLTPINSLVNLISRTRSNSGRYGLFHPMSHLDTPSPHYSPASSEESSMSDDHDSDIEEVSAPSPSRKHSLHIKIPAFKSFIHSICRSNDGSSSSPVKDTFPSFADFLVTPSPSLEDLRTPSPAIVVVDTISTSRSHSPMEMSTPSPSAPCEAHHVEPPVVGAWPLSRSESPHPPTEDDASKDDNDNVVVEAPPAPAESISAVPVPVTTEGRVSPSFPDVHPCSFIDLPPPQFFPLGPSFGRHLSSPFNATHPAPSGLPGANSTTERISNELRASVKIIEDRISAMQDTISDLRTRQTFTEEDVMDLQTHVDMIEPESDRVFCRLNLAERNIASLSTLQTQVNALKNRLDDPEPKSTELSTSDLKACAEALGSLVTGVARRRGKAYRREDDGDRRCPHGSAEGNSC
ncbi:hypothetical protein EDC04DRAFT_284274 [Pisolithus marmoratus]|nr:hypothetical protein EDC04DRAFT_284274 [Pisolithus marmoratus]